MMAVGDDFNPGPQPEWLDDSPPRDDPPFGVIRGGKSKAAPPAPPPATAPPAAPPSVSAILRSAAERPPARVFPTGFVDLDRLLDGGLRARDLHVLAAPPGAGKTYLIGQVAQWLASEIPVLWIATEIDEETQAARLAALLVPCRPSEIIDRRVDPLVAAERAAKLRIHVAELDPYQTIDPIVRISEYVAGMRETYGSCPAIVVDYLQMLAANPDFDHVRHAVGRHAYVLRQMARTLDVPVLAVSSTARSHYGRAASDLSDATDPRAWLAAAKESGDVEFAAAVLMVLETGEPDDNGVAPARLILPKVRRGERGFVGLRFDGRRGVFAPDAPAVEEMGAGKRNAEDDQRVLAAVASASAYPRPRTAWKGQIPGLGSGRTMAAIDRLVSTGALVVRASEIADAGGRRRVVQLVCVADSAGERE